jgi:membrane protease YdiL (CAAX protease family)
VDSPPIDGPSQDSWTPSLPARPEAPVSRWFAAVQVFLVCGIPTQTVVFLALLGSGSPMGSDGTMLVEPSKMSLEFFAMASLFDTALVAILIRVFLAISGETSREVFLGSRPVLREALRGLALVPVLWIAVITLVYVITTLLPGLHNVPNNPLAAYMDTPLKAGVFIMVVMLAGGVREELQRGFILRRFDQRLGGAWIGLAVFSVAFGLFHLQQGFDAALAVGLLGVIWGVLYIRRGSVVAPMVSHAGFDVAQVLLKSLTT